MFLCMLYVQCMYKPQKPAVNNRFMRYKKSTALGAGKKETYKQYHYTIGTFAAQSQKCANVVPILNFL